MAVSYSANAVYAKAHALYGKRLKKQNYDDLLGCRSLQELVGYLKSRTQYSPVFENVPSELSAAQIEELLKLHLLENLEAISRYEISAGESLYEYFIVKNDVNQLLSFIRLLISKTPEKYLSSLPPFFNKRTELDLISMANARSYNEFLNSLGGTEYKKLLAPFAGNYSDKGIYLQIEAVLNAYTRKYLLAAVNKGINKKEKQQIREIVNYKFDMDTIVDIYRLIRLEDADEEIIKSFINTEFTNFTDKELDMLIDAPRARDMMRLMPETCYRKDFSKIEYNYLEGAAQQVLYAKAYDSMRYFTSPTAVMLSYVSLAENEVQNIIRIVEGIKYKIPAKKISTVLVGAE